MAKYKKMY